WPGSRLLVQSVLLGGCQVLWFFLIYGGGNYLTTLPLRRVPLPFGLGVGVALFPLVVLGYMSGYPLFVIAAIVFPTPQRNFSLVLTLASIPLVAGIFFLLLPADLYFPPEPDSGNWTWLVEFAKRIALEHNFLPSLHVGMSAVCVLVYTPRAGPLGKILLWLWSAFISASTMLIHQHYVVDVITGYALAWAGVQWGYRRWVQQGK